MSTACILTYSTLSIMIWYSSGGVRIVYERCVHDCIMLQMIHERQHRFGVVFALDRINFGQQGIRVYNHHCFSSHCVEKTSSTEQVIHHKLLDRLFKRLTFKKV